MSQIILPGQRKESRQALAVKTLNGRVVLELEHPAQYIALTAEEAAQLARMMAMCAADLARKQGLIKDPNQLPS